MYLGLFDLLVNETYRSYLDKAVYFTTFEFVLLWLTSSLFENNNTLIDKVQGLLRARLRISYISEALPGKDGLITLELVNM